MASVTPRLMAYHVREPLGGSGGSPVERFIAAAEAFKGQPYKWGGGHVGSTFTKPGPVDCSGLVMQAARMAGLNFDGTAAVQQDKGRPVSLNALQRGDLVFRGNPAYHVGIYLGNGQVLHSPKTGDVVRVTTVDGWDNARRLFDARDRAPAADDRPQPAPQPAPVSVDRYEPAPMPQPGPTYVPQPGETLLEIAARTLGNEDRWMEIYRLNQAVMPSPYVLFPGQPITLPAGAQVTPAVQPAAPQAATGAVGAFQNVQAFLGGAKDKLAQIMAGMAMA